MMGRVEGVDDVLGRILKTVGGLLTDLGIYVGYDGSGRTPRWRTAKKPNANKTLNE